MPLVHHATNIRQELGVEALDGVHDDRFFEAQLLRTISLALSAVGFDSVTPTALEAFRAEVEICMFSPAISKALGTDSRLQTYSTSSARFAGACSQIDELSLYHKTLLLRWQREVYGHTNSRRTLS
jgi:hypothetical protein